MGRRKIDAEIRFFSNVKDSKNKYGCWTWTGSRKQLGHGQISVSGRTEPAHRFSYQMLYGAVDLNLDIDHVCQNAWCVNPGHLEPVTHMENIRRAARPGMVFCKVGHKRIKSNIYIVRETYELCWECKNNRARAWDRKNKSTIP
jgi:hypothetical protein